MAQTLFQKYGGFAKVSRVVSGFYDKALESPLLGPYFEAVDMKRLIEDDFIRSEKGEFEVKGFGSIVLYDLTGEHAHRR